MGLPEAASTRSCSFSHPLVTMAEAYALKITHKTFTLQGSIMVQIPLLNCSCQDHVTPKCVVNSSISGLEDPSLDPHMLTSSVSHKVCPNIFVTG